MPKIIYVQHDGTVHEVDVDEGLTVMEGAIRHDIEGIEAECGGSCMCATCHVYVAEAFADLLPLPDESELEMLEDTAAERRLNSRLSCQIEVTAELDGLVVRLPETQL
ncbi:MAG: 2Fe-2S iron-sulfur cluster-binding protein [Alphaproteobacteria bacterium]|nr:2Fe-2S iron-sulfur cluster-binding protein [Alphaproteobacteria bacterium]